MTAKNPQLENGYLKIATELFEALSTFRIPGELRQVFDAIIRKTYGFNKKEDAIANSQIVEATKMKRQNVSRALALLVKNRLVIRSDDKTGKGNILKINKDYSQWIAFGIRSDDKKKVSSKRIRKSSKVMTTRIRSDDKVSSEVMDTKDKRHSKDILQKTGKDIEQARWARDIIEAFSFINPAMKKSYGNTVQRQACVDLVKEYTFERVMFIIQNTLPKTNAQAFFPTILTPHKLFQDWARLEAAVMKWKSKSNNQGRGLA